MARGELLASRLVEENINISTSYTSDGISLRLQNRCSVHVVITNTNAVGVLSFEVSNNNSDWVNLGYVDATTDSYNAEYSVSSGVNINEMFDFSDLGCRYLRVKYVATSGSGIMSLWAFRKHN